MIIKIIRVRKNEQIKKLKNLRQFTMSKHEWLVTLKLFTFHLVSLSYNFKLLTALINTWWCTQCICRHKSICKCSFRSSFPLRLRIICCDTLIFVDHIYFSCGEDFRTISFVIVCCQINRQRESKWDAKVEQKHLITGFNGRCINACCVEQKGGREEKSENVFKNY